MYQMTGFGAYPGDAYFDPNRAGWLPYWLDTPTESQAKYAWLLSSGRVTAEQVANPGAVYRPTLAPPAVRPPSDIVNPAPNAVDEVIARQSQEWKGQSRGFFEELADEIAPCSVAGFSCMSLAIVSAGIFGAVLLTRGGRR